MSMGVATEGRAPPLDFHTWHTSYKGLIVLFFVFFLLFFGWQPLENFSADALGHEA